MEIPVQHMRRCMLIGRSVDCSVLYFIGACVLREALSLAMKWGRGGDVFLHLAALTCFPAVPLSDSIIEHGPNFVRFTSVLVAVLKVPCPIGANTKHVQTCVLVCLCACVLVCLCPHDGMCM